MLCTVIRSDMRSATADLSHAQAVELSELVEVACVVSHAETINGKRAAYIDGSMTQYDPVRGELLNYGTNHAPFDSHLGWTS